MLNISLEASHVLDDTPRNMCNFFDSMASIASLNAATYVILMIALCVVFTALLRPMETRAGLFQSKLFVAAARDLSSTSSSLPPAFRSLSCGSTFCRLNSISSGHAMGESVAALKTVVKVFENVYVWSCASTSYSNKLRSNVRSALICSQIIFNVPLECWPTGRSSVMRNRIIYNGQRQRQNHPFPKTTICDYVDVIYSHERKGRTLQLAPN